MGNLTLSLPIVYWPWMLALFFVGIDRRKIAPLAVGGIMLALTVTEGNYTFVYVWRPHRRAFASYDIDATKRPTVIAAFVLVVFGVAIAAIKLLPVANTLALYPRGGWTSRMPTRCS